MNAQVNSDRRETTTIYRVGKKSTFTRTFPSYETIVDEEENVSISIPL